MAETNQTRITPRTQRLLENYISAQPTKIPRTAVIEAAVAEFVAKHMQPAKETQ